MQWYQGTVIHLYNFWSQSLFCSLKFSRLMLISWWLKIDLIMQGAPMAKTWQCPTERLKPWLKKLFGQRSHGKMNSTTQVMISINQVSRLEAAILHRYDSYGMSHTVWDRKNIRTLHRLVNYSVWFIRLKVVWRDSKELGIGVPQHGRKFIVVGRYRRAGNVSYTECFEDNVKPLKTGHWPSD